MVEKHCGIKNLKEKTRVNYLAFSSGNVCCFMAVNVLSLMNKMLARQKANTLELFWMMKAKTEERNERKGIARSKEQKESSFIPKSQKNFSDTFMDSFLSVCHYSFS